MITLEILDTVNEAKLLELKRGDIPASFVEPPEYTIRLSHYGNENHFSGFCTAVKYDGKYVGIALVGEAKLGPKDPSELKDLHPYRIIGFLIDHRYRGKGIGKQAFSLILEKFYQEYGNLPLLLHCCIENIRARNLYESFGFARTGILDGQDEIMLKMTL